MTDSSDPTSPKSSRRKSSRQPATIDLKPTVIDEGVRPDEAAAEGPKVQPQTRETGSTEEMAVPEEAGQPDDTLAATRSADETIATGEPDASVDAGVGVDAVGPDGAAETRSTAGPPQRDRFAPLVGAGLIGGLLGAGITLGVQALVPYAQDDRRIAELEQRINALPRNGNTERSATRLNAIVESNRSLAERVASVESLAKNADARAQEALNRPLPAATPSDTNALTDLSNRVAGLEDQVRTGMQSVTQSSQALDQRVGEQDRRIDEQARKIAEQDQQFAALSRQITDGTSSATRAGVAVILVDRLIDALDRGAPYADILDALRKFEGEAGRLAPLEPFAGRGAPTAAALAEAFKPLGDAIIRDARSGAEGWGDRLMRMVDRVVTVRSVNETDATGVPSLVARIENALKRGDIQGAMQAWDALPEPSRRLSEDWARQARQRASADAAAQALVSDAVAALNRTTP